MLTMSADHTVPLPDLLRRVLTFGTALNAVCSNMYATAFLLHHQIRMKDDLRFGEDWFFNLECMKYVRCARYLDQSIYNCRRGVASATSNYHADDFHQRGVLMYSRAREYAQYFGVPSLAANEFLRVAIHCASQEFRRDAAPSTATASTVVRENFAHPLLQEAVRHLDTRTLTPKERLLAGLLRLHWYTPLLHYYRVKKVLGAYRSRLFPGRGETTDSRALRPYQPSRRDG